MRLTLILVTFVFASSASAVDYMMIDVEEDKQPPAADPKEPPSTQRPAVLTSWSACPTGYCFEYSNGSVVNETFAAYMQRTGKRPPAAQPTCSTGYCGTFTSRVTLPTAGCTCGCNASSCSCHHSPNEGKPLAQQRLNDSVPAVVSREMQQGYETGMTPRGRILFRRLFRR